MNVSISFFIPVMEIVCEYKLSFYHDHIVPDYTCYLWVGTDANVYLWQSCSAMNQALILTVYWLADIPS